MTRLFVVGLSHRTAPLDIREGMSVSGESLREHLRELGVALGDAMVVSTCNRYELYAAPPEPLTLDEVQALVLKRRPEVRPYLYQHAGEAALRHLFRVAASLDSLVVGEPQILGQVKDAFQAALEAGTGGGLLQRVVPRSFAVAKRVRSETAIGKNSASVASVAVGLASHVFGDLAGHPVLLIGAGKMAELAARHLKQARVEQLWVINRTRSRAEALAERLSGTAHDFTELEALLARAAVVLCSTGAQEPVLQKELVGRVMKARRGRWLLFIDIAVPRDVDPRVGELENVYLYDIDALQGVVADNRVERQREAEQAERIVAEELARFLQAEKALGVAPTIRLLRERSLGVARREVEKLLPRLQGVTERDQKLIVQMAEGIVNKLLHPPLTALKAAEPELLEATQRLFALDEAPVPSVKDEEETR